MPTRRYHHRFRAGIGAVVVVLFASGASSARAAEAQFCDASAYGLSLRSLTGPAGADLVIRITTATPGCELPETLTSVEATIHALDGSGRRRVKQVDARSPDGSAKVHLGRVVRRQRVTATITFGPQILLAGRARTLLRPDLVVRSVNGPRAVVSGQAFNLSVTIGERTRDLGAAATVTVSAGGAVVGTGTATIARLRRAVLKIPAALTGAGRIRLTIAVTADLPETTTKNNAGRTAVEVTDFKVVTSAVVVPSLAGYGGQFNHHVYAAISRAVGVTDENVADMEGKMRALHPQFSRIFFTPRAFGDPDRMQSFVRTVLLAQSAGATINVTWQGGTLDVKGGNVQRFADVLIDLVRNRGVTRLRWLTLQNEPNRTRITPEQYEAAYRALDPYIQSIRGQVKYMGGDLVRGLDSGGSNQELWFDYLAAHMADILDAYSIHVFWDYWDTQKLQERLLEVRAIVDALPKTARKPLYVAEYGVRGIRTFNGVRQVDPGVWTDGTPITRTNVSAFQHAWFDILSARLGYLGTSKWDSYFGMYDPAEQAFYMIGKPQEGWPLYPLYHLVRLMTTTVKPGWSVVGVDSVPETTRLLAAYAGAKGQRTVVGLDTAGAQLNAPSPTPVAYSIGGLPPSQSLHLAVWNEAGDGLVGSARTVVADTAGVASITVPQHGVFVLTTLRLA